MLMNLMTTAGATLVLWCGLAALLTGINHTTLQRLVNLAQRDSAHVWWAKPGLWWHETTHALVGALFGLRVAEFSLRARGETAGHVTFRLRRWSWWQHLGLFLAAGAPVWTSACAILLVGKAVWWPRVAWAAIGQSTLAPNWPGVLAWGLMSLALSLGAVLSVADLRQLLRGTPAAAALLVVVFAVLAWAWPTGLAAWRRLNGLLAVAGLVVAGLSTGLSLLTAGFARR
ncbi:hypothetical protein [Lacticaseibacillus parakribbianus]|uniref:hypothetical protein n=1 Tax=Lacticaseibacillus parakribbianus TaxID=2970927 RepID=UPI0021CAFDA6|nr:hypothetical protein [Lacticaseibacillus parakribbianus]